MKHTSIIPATILHLACALASLLLTQSLYILARNSPTENTSKSNLSVLKNRIDPRSYSFEGDDLPLRIPLSKVDHMVMMEVEESVHYSLVNDPEAHDEWIYGTPYGGGTYRVGTLNRTLIVILFHQLHCVRTMGELLAEGGTYHHAQHCLRYLREEILCEANTTLEPGDFTLSNFTEERVGATHVCRDWTHVYKEVEQNWAVWRNSVNSK